MNKKITIAMVTLVVILSIFLYGCDNNEQNPQKIPDIYTTEKIVKLGEEFTLVKNESARVKELNVSLRINDFIYSPCPKGSRCKWSGLAVVYELTVDGIPYGSSLDNPPYEAPYDVFVKKTDYKTYATFVIDKPENSCIKRSGISQDECWRGLAKRFNDESYCNSIQSLITKDACYEDLAEKQNKSDLCDNVVSPKQYCQYLKLVTQNSLTKCDSIIIFHWRVRCFKEIAENSGKGIDICNTLESDKAQVCKEMIAGSDY